MGNPASVTSDDSTVATGTSAVDTALTPAPIVVDPVQKSLTTGINNFTGTSADDTFDASTAGSLDTSDTIDGLGGTDNLTAVVGTESIRPTISNVEYITFQTTGNLTVDARDITGMTNLGNESGGGTLTVNNLGVVPTGSLNSTGGNNTTLNFLNATLSGTDDMSVTVNNHAAADLIVTDTVGTNKLETLSLTSSSLPSTITTLNTGGVGTSTLNVSGDANLTITNALDNAITSVSAGDFTGALSATLGGVATGGVNATTGSGADSLDRGCWSGHY